MSSESNDISYPHADIGGRLKRIRASLSQKAFSAILGIEQPQYNRYEKGRVKPSHKILGKIASYGNVSIDWILFGDETRYMRYNAVSVDDALVSEDKPDSLAESRVPYHASRKRAMMSLERKWIPSDLPPQKAQGSDDENVLLKALRVLPDNDAVSVIEVLKDKLLDNTELNDELTPLISELDRIISAGSFNASRSVEEMLMKEFASGRTDSITKEDLKKMIIRSMLRK